VKSSAFEKVLGEYVSSEKREGLSANQVRAEILEAALWIGILRLYSQRIKLNLKFEGISFEKFIEKASLKLDVLNMIQEVKNKSVMHHLVESEIEKDLRAIHAETKTHEWQICCGHDLSEILSFIFRKKYASRSAAIVSVEVIERSLRLAFETEHFKETSLFGQIRQWETANSPYRIVVS
jgi:hypothetical protein